MDIFWDCSKFISEFKNIPLVYDADGVWFWVDINTKNEFDKNYTSEFNKNYSLRKNRFTERKKIMKYRKIKINDFPNWKTYLLSRLYPDLNEDWQFNFYNAINDEYYENQYLFQNELFFEDFSISNMPQSIIKKINKLNFISFE